MYGNCGMGIILSWGSAHEALGLVQAAHYTVPDCTIAVIGAGVIGLTTAYLLLTHGYRVRVYARDLPPHTTSNIAAGLWSVGKRSRPKDDQLFDRLQRTSWNTYTALADNPDAALRGVARMNIYAFNADPGLAVPLVPEGLMPMPVTTDVRMGIYTKQATCYETFRIDVPIYMDDLFNVVVRMGAEVIRKTIHSFSELPEDIIVNCTGLGARELAQDSTVYPVRGQLLYLDPQKSIDYMVFAKIEDSGQKAYVFLLPQESRLVIGTTFDPDNTNQDIDPTISEALLMHAAQFFDQVPVA